MPEKRFTEEEARRIFARVAERQSVVSEGETGLTLAEMQEAARASGLDPALVAAVAAELAGGADSEVPTFMGVPLTVRQTRVVPVKVGDEGWARIVGELRRAFGSPGVPTDLGTVREWTSTTQGHGVPVHVSLVPGEGSATITIEQTVASQARGAGWIFPGTVAPMVLLAALLQATGGLGAEIWLLPAMVGGVVAIVMVSLWLMWSAWARRTERQFERVLDRAELAARDAASLPASGTEPTDSRDGPERSPGGPTLSLGDLPEADRADPARTRTRARS